MASSKGVLRRIGVRAALVLFSLAATALVGEALIRATDPFGISYYRDTNRYFNEAIDIPPDAGRPDGRLFQNRRGIELSFTDFDFTTNALGMRSSRTDDGVTVDRSGASAGRSRVLFLGDSVTLAWGVDDGDSWIRTLEREARAADGRPLECLNAGHLQYNTIQESDWLATFGPHLQPDAVVLTYVVNDLDDAWAVYEEWQALLAAGEAAEGPGGVELARQKLLTWFRGIHGLWHFFDSRREAQTVGEMKLERVEDAPGYAERWPLSEAALDRIAGFCAERGIPFVVLDHTTPRIPGVRAWCEGSGTPYYDFTFTDAEWERDIRNSLADSHANALGNRLLAEKALAALRDAGLLAEAEH